MGFEETDRLEEKKMKTASGPEAKPASTIKESQAGRLGDSARPESRPLSSDISFTGGGIRVILAFMLSGKCT